MWDGDVLHFTYALPSVNIPESPTLVLACRRPRIERAVSQALDSAQAPMVALKQMRSGAQPFTTMLSSKPIAFSVCPAWPKYRIVAPYVTALGCALSEGAPGFPPF